MVRRKRLLAQVALLGMLGILAFPSASSALRPTFVIALTSSGASPAIFDTPAGLGSISFHNTDTVTHTIAFANGSCSGQVAPGAQLNCGFLAYVGDYTYTVDGTTTAHVVAQAVGRSVSLTAKSDSVSRGSLVTLHGRLEEENSNWSPPSAGEPQRIIVIARPYPGHPFHRVAVVMATAHPGTKTAPWGELLWRADIHPRRGMTYIAIASFQPAGGTVWQRARSEPFRVDVRR